MFRKTLFTIFVIYAAAGSFAGSASPAVPAVEDWTDWRGPRRDGHSAETGLPTSWSRDGDNLAWRVPHGGRSTPIILGDHLYLQNAAGEGANLQERIMCFDVEAGRALVGASDAHLLERRTASPRGLGLPGRGPDDGQHLCLHGRRLRSRVQRRRRRFVGALAHRGLRPHHDPWRPHRLTYHRRQPAHRERSELRMGRASTRRSAFLRFRQSHGGNTMGQLSRRAPV